MSHSSQSYVRGHLVLVVDCGDLERSARFWASVLGYDRADPPGGPYQGLVPARGQGIEILLQRVPEAKTGKNRLHLDLRTPDLDAEVALKTILSRYSLTSAGQEAGAVRRSACAAGRRNRRAPGRTGTAISTPDIATPAAAPPPSGHHATARHPHGHRPPSPLPQDSPNRADHAPAHP